MSSRASCVEGTSDELQPSKYLKAKATADGQRCGDPGVALIILNSPIQDLKYFRRLCEHASFRICADGGANRLHDVVLNGTATQDWSEALQQLLPDTIHGDLDSLDKQVRERYEHLGVEISEDPDQYSTDFGKSIKKIVERMPAVRNILIHGSLGGRVDQGIGLLHELYREQSLRHPKVRFWLLTESSVSVLLRTGTTVLQTPLGEGLITRNIGILPLYGPARISTMGLEWDVDDWPTELGGQVSTSNHIVSDSVTIRTDNDVLFTVERSGQ
ncbi:hypothetical protein B0A50_02799 [Salinomyces thailandicus]|uniref:Thiamine pyrophosphokinase n=1 Tax=Salinomyces thailandicus TaxID=706561 RepID=A0A4U0U4N3_9PEZI|nr:hypothetical protein B0A50_02799 [Salinomyces thailandica]